MTSRDRSKDSPAALAEISALKDENGDLKKRIKQFEEAELSYIEDRRRSEEVIREREQINRDPLIFNLL